MKRLAILLFAFSFPALAADVGIPKPTLFDDHATPAAILRGLFFAESSMRPRVVGDDGISRGGFQLNRCFDRERAKRWGAFDPFNLADAIRITDALFQANLRALLMRERMIDPSTWGTRREDMAIASHRQGLRGMLRDGMGYWYVKRCRRSGE